MNSRIIVALALLTAAVLACDTILLPDATSTPTVPPKAPATPIPPTPDPKPTQTLLPFPTLAPTPGLPDVWLGPSDVLVHPDGGLFSGDRVSFQVQVHSNRGDVGSVPVEMTLPDGRHSESSTSAAALYSTRQAYFEWVWDTTGFLGTWTVTVTLDPRHTLGAADVITANNSTVVTLTLRPKDEMPLDERGARWATRETACCQFHFVTGSAAERDVEQIVSAASEAAAFDERQLGERLRGKVDVYLVGRVLGHGGFARDMIGISYLDRNYAAGDLTQVLRHEMVHVLSRQFADGLATFVAEGLAVWASGGHYEPEHLSERAAALLQRGGYVPLRSLADDFYSHQHETGYLEAGSLIEYLVERDGLDTFKRFLRVLSYQHEDNAEAVDRALRQTYAVGLDEIEREWLDRLRALDVSPGLRDDLDVTIAYYDTVRRYEQALDPSAYYRQVWLPDMRRAESLGIVADWTRHPRADENVALETMLIAAHDAQQAGDGAAAWRMLKSVNAVLDAGRGFRETTAAQYLALVRAARAAGWEPQRISQAGDTATVVGVRAGGKPTSLTFTRTPDGWRAQ